MLTTKTLKEKKECNLTCVEVVYGMREMGSAVEKGEMKMMKI